MNSSKAKKDLLNKLKSKRDILFTKNGIFIKVNTKIYNESIYNDESIYYNQVEILQHDKILASSDISSNHTEFLLYDLLVKLYTKSPQKELYLMVRATHIIVDMSQNFNESWKTQTTEVINQINPYLNKPSHKFLLQPLIQQSN